GEVSGRLNERTELLTTIARCPIVEKCIADPSPAHNCGEIVLYQWPEVPFEQRLERWQSEHHAPEPWVGHLKTATLLFLSSNPSLTSRRKPGPPAKKTPPLERLGAHTVGDHPSLSRGLAAAKWDWRDEELI